MISLSPQCVSMRVCVRESVSVCPDECADCSGLDSGYYDFYTTPLPWRQTPNMAAKERLSMNPSTETHTHAFTHTHPMPGPV